ncbi:MAG: hypothetical protein J5545_03505 [Bacteroidaceae bacterium]|nr:hypothetical protein [Bacteroidaceae bacterium]
MDQWPNFQVFTFREFSFSVESYKEYICGCLVNSGYVNCVVTFKQHNNGNYHLGGVISVQIRNNPLKDKILSSFEFDSCVTMGDRLMMYIGANHSNVDDTSLHMMTSFMGYTRERKDYVTNEPTVGNIFTTNQQIVRIAFKFVNPDRLIEFY